MAHRAPRVGLPGDPRSVIAFWIQSMAVTGYNAPTANKPLNVRDRDLLEVAIAIYIPKRIYIAKPTLPPSLIYRTRYTPDMSLYTAFEK